MASWPPKNLVEVRVPLAHPLDSTSPLITRPPVRRQTAVQVTELIWPKWAGPVTKKTWDDFKEMKLSQYKFRYKSLNTEQVAINLLAEYFDNGQDCVAALKEATAKTWKFPVDPGERSFRMPKQEPEWTPQG